MGALCLSWRAAKPLGFVAPWQHSGIAPEAIRCNCPVRTPQLPKVHTLGSLSTEGEEQPGFTKHLQESLFFDR